MDIFDIFVEKVRKGERSFSLEAQNRVYHVMSFDDNDIRYFYVLNCYQGDIAGTESAKQLAIKKGETIYILDGSPLDSQLLSRLRPCDVAMAAMLMGSPDQEDLEKLEKTGYLSVCDPTCGSGCLLIAAGWVCEERQKIENPKEHLFFVGQDLDRVVALMCYIQLSILGYAGYVIVGDFLTKPITGEGLIIIQAEGTEHWLTPAFFTEPWVSRVEQEFACLEEKEGQYGKQEAV